MVRLLKLTLSLVMVVGVGVGVHRTFFDTPTSPKEQETVSICHGLSGPLAQYFDEILADFNASQDQVKVLGVPEKGYVEAYHSAKCGSTKADLYLVSEFGTPSLILKGKQCQEFIPVSQIIPSLAQRDYLAGLSYLYGDPDKGILYALPFNPSVGIAYYNQDAFKAAGLDPDVPLTTWGDIEKGLGKIGASWVCWVYLPMDSRIHL